MKLKIICIFCFLLVSTVCFGNENEFQFSSSGHFKQLGKPSERSSLYTEKQNKHIGPGNPSINKFFNYDAGAVSYKSNLYDSDPFSKHDELGRKYDLFFDYEAGNPLYNKPAYNTDYFVRTDNFGNKYDKFYDEETASVNYNKLFYDIGYFDQINELHQQTDKFYNYGDGVYRYRAEENFDDNAIIYRVGYIERQVWDPKDEYIGKLTGNDFREYIGEKYLEYKKLPFHLVYENYNKSLASQQDPSIDTGREHVNVDYFTKYDRYGNRYDKYFETPEVTSQRAIGIYPYQMYNANSYPYVPFFQFSYADETKEIKLSTTYPYRYSFRRSPYYFEFKQKYSATNNREFFWNYNKDKFKTSFLKGLSD